MGKMHFWDGTVIDHFRRLWRKSQCGNYYEYAEKPVDRMTNNIKHVDCKRCLKKADKSI